VAYVTRISRKGDNQKNNNEKRKEEEDSKRRRQGTINGMDSRSTGRGK
jgi:hypothetical protein